MSDHREQYEAGRIATSSGGAPKAMSSPAPDPDVITSGPAAGQHKDYWVLSAAERAKGFVRPVRLTYRHVGLPKPRFELRDLTEQELEWYAGVGYVKYEPYPESDRPALGRFWTQDDLNRVDRGCGFVTRMSRPIAETYAREPHFYGSTFCVGCGVHLPVGENGEFVWEHSDERVGT